MNRRSFIKTFIATITGSSIPATASVNPEPKKLLLLNTQLAGFQYYQGDTIFSRLDQGDSLTLKRDPINRFDSNAMEVYWGQHKLGHISQTANIGLAQMMDRGETLQAQIETLAMSYDPWQRVGLGVYWVESTL